MSQWDAIVIGSGIGGLGAAGLLARIGKKVLVLERHYVAGGFTHTFSRKGYEWDVGVHYIGEVERPDSMLSKIFDHLTDGNLKWAPMGEVYDSVWFGQEHYPFVAGAKNFQDSLINRFPEEKKAIESYFLAVRETISASKNFFISKALPSWTQSFCSPLLQKKFHRYSKLTTREVISQWTQNEKLIGVLTAQFGDYGLPPAQSSFAIHAMVVKHYLGGGSYPVGGSARMAETIIPGIEAAGGKVRLKADVAQILVRNQRAAGVKLTSGEEILAPCVISDAGVLNTFGRLLSPDVAATCGYPQNFKSVRPSAAHVCLYVGFKKTAEELGFKKSNLWIYSEYNHDENLARYLKDPSGPLPLTYISFPSAKDPDFLRRHPGRATLEAIGFAPYEWFQKWEENPWQKRGDDYNSLKEKFKERLLEVIYQYVPGTRGQVDYAELSTPLSTRHFANYPHGEIYGLDHTPERFSHKGLKPRTAVKGLYLTGQDIVSDGIAGALFGGVLTASVVSGKNLIKKIMRLG